MDDEQRKTGLPDSVEYVGFFDRVGAALIDTVLFLAVTFPIGFIIYGNHITLLGGTGTLNIWGLLFTELLPVVAIILFWYFKGATPGKLMMAMKVVDDITGATPSLKQSILRYLGYILSTIPLLIGFFWIAFDKKKQGWHDKLSGTVVVRAKKSS